MPFKGLLLPVLLLLQAIAWGQVTLDSTFGTNGVAKVSLDDYNQAVKVIKLDNDTLLLLANVTPQDTVVKTDFAIIKLTPDGSVDSTFGTNGYVRYHFYKKEVSNACTFIRLSNGQLMVCGSGYSYANPTYLPACLMRLDADGSVDSTFGRSGTLDVPFAGIQEFPTTLKQLASGKLMLGGYSIDTTDTHSNVPVMARMDIDGNLDSAFGTNGRVYIRFGGGFIHARHLIGGVLYDILELADNSTLVSGGYSDFYNLVSYVMRVLPSGAIDTVFMGRGYFSADFTTLYNSQIIKMERDSIGKLWFAASSNALQEKDFYLGNIDLTDSSYHTGAIDYQANEDVLTDMLLDNNGNPVMVGKSIKPANNHIGYVSDYFAIALQPVATFPYNDRKLTFTDDTTVQCGAISAVLQSHNRVVCYGFQNRANNTSQLMLIRASINNSVGVQQVAMDSESLMIYPNPASNTLHFKLPETGIENFQLTIYNSLGAVVLQQSISAADAVSINGWASGVYLAHVSGNGYDGTVKFEHK